MSQECIAYRVSKQKRIVGLWFKGLLLFCLFFVPLICYSQVHVRGYYRKDGTYVRPHVRSNPDGNPYNNWSFPGNVNPYTGKQATGNPDTYLKNYYKDRSASSSDDSYMYNYSPYESNQRYVAVNVLNVRKAPTTNSAIINKLNYADVVTIKNVDKGWAYIEWITIEPYTLLLTRMNGYVSVKYLK